MNKTGLIAKMSIKYVLPTCIGNISGGFRVFLGISWDFAEIPEFRGSATTGNIRSPEYRTHIANNSMNTTCLQLPLLAACNTPASG